MRHCKDQTEVKQLDLALDDSKNRPPMAPATPAIIEALAELLLTAAGKLTEEMSDDADKNHH